MNIEFVKETDFFIESQGFQKKKSENTRTTMVDSSNTRMFNFGIS